MAEARPTRRGCIQRAAEEDRHHHAHPIVGKVTGGGQAPEGQEAQEVVRQESPQEEVEGNEPGFDRVPNAHAEAQPRGVAT